MNEIVSLVHALFEIAITVCIHRYKWRCGCSAGEIESSTEQFLLQGVETNFVIVRGRR